MRLPWRKYTGRIVNGKARLTAGALLRTGINMDVAKKGFYFLGATLILGLLIGFWAGYVAGTPDEHTIAELMAIPDSKVQECQIKITEDDSFQELMCRKLILEAD